ncbi:hypothetical protein [Actinoplanes xinjiangensis]|uniref:NHL domain-containing protein n=1 Tax=Actinoplanes xinjiangensis TaxID=512350 RepID=UPI003F4DCF6F
MRFRKPVTARLETTVLAAAVAVVASLASPSVATPSFADSSEAGVTVFAGSGERGAAQEGVPAPRSPMNNPTGVAVGPDGTVYVSDSGNHLVRAVGTDGVIRTVAGTGRDGAGAPAPASGARATEVPLAFPSDLAIGRDGTVFIADGGTVRVYALKPDGTISVRADASTGNGILPSPMGAPSGLAVASDDTLYIADRTNFQVIALSPDGAVRLVAGGMGGAVSTAQGPATETPVGPVTGITIDAAGDLWLSSAGKLLRVSGTTLTPVAEDVGTATTVSAGADGVYIVDQPERVIRRLAPDHRVTVVTTFDDAQQPILWAAASFAPAGPIYVVDNAVNQVLAARATPITDSGAEPASDRTWPYFVGGVVALILAAVAAVWWVRRRQASVRRESGTE